MRKWEIHAEEFSAGVNFAEAWKLVFAENFSPNYESVLIFRLRSSLTI